jgi:outer membrane protein assembly factor BamB
MAALFLRGILILTVLSALASCANRDEILPGERVGLRDVLQEEINRPGSADAEAEAAPLALPAPVVNPDWTHRNGGPQHRIAHPALAPNPALLWSADIGRGNDRQHRITTEPVVADQRIFTLDARSTVTATSANGARLWSVNLADALNLRDPGSGGGLAIGDGKLFVASALRLLVALEPETGSIIWSQKFDAPVTAAPTVFDQTVYVVANDASAWAIDTENGRVRWQLPGTPTSSSMVGGAGPAANDRLVIFPFPSGEVTAAMRRAGVRIWGSSVAGKRRGRAWGSVSDITGDPVIVGDTVYIGNQSGRVVALDVRTGERRWTANEAAYSPVWRVDDAIYLISDEAQLVRLNANTGARVWAQQLPDFIKAGFRLNPLVRRDQRLAVYKHFGPVLAGGRLIVASDDGKLRFFDPQSGELLTEIALRRGAAAGPVVAGQTLYVVTENGQLHAFR